MFSWTFKSVTSVLKNLKKTYRGGELSFSRHKYCAHTCNYIRYIFATLWKILLYTEACRVRCRYAGVGLVFISRLRHNRNRCYRTKYKKNRILHNSFGLSSHRRQTWTIYYYCRVYNTFWIIIYIVYFVGSSRR